VTTPSGTALSADGTCIAYWTTGHGPPLVLVHGAPADHTRWQPLLPFLEPHVTVHALDRRGRGGSADGPAYSLAREHEDVAAVVEQVAAVTGSPVDVYGHSFGALVTFGAALLTDQVRQLVLYEGWPLPDPSAYALPAGLVERMDALLAVGDREGVVEALFRSLELMSDDDWAAFRCAPSWAGRVAAAHTLPRECRSMLAARLDRDEAARLDVPVLLVVGESSADPARSRVDAVAAALPRSQLAVLPGQQHVGDVMEPRAFAEVLLAFLT